MRAPRVRFKVWYMMVAILVVALGFGYLRRPYPVKTGIVIKSDENSNSSIYIRYHWSDGRVQHVAAQNPSGPGPIIGRDLKTNEPWPRDHSRLGPLLRIEWSDGSKSYYLGRE
jgi:hypothetical protein